LSKIRGKNENKAKEICGNNINLILWTFQAAGIKVEEEITKWKAISNSLNIRDSECHNGEGSGTQSPARKYGTDIFLENLRKAHRRRVKIKADMDVLVECEKLGDDGLINVKAEMEIILKIYANLGQVLNSWEKFCIYLVGLRNAISVKTLKNKARIFKNKDAETEIENLNVCSNMQIKIDLRIHSKSKNQMRLFSD
jgi:hypothetical protein